MSDQPHYDVVVVGGGPAGLTTALYTTRLGLRTALFERQGGRHGVVANVHNLLGVSEDVSGDQLAEMGIRQLEEYGADVYPDAVATVTNGDRFRVEGAHATVMGERVVLATGFTDISPNVPGLERFTGRGLHYCLHCDAYTLGDSSVFVLGHDDHAAEIAMLMLNFTDDVDLLLDGESPDWDETTDRQVAGHPVERVDQEVVSAFTRAEGPKPWLDGLEFADGHDREYLGGFAVYGREYNVELAEELGCDLTDDGALAVDENQETSVDGIYGVGDVTHGQNQTPIAIGDGAKAGIALHKDLRRYPRPPNTVSDEGGTRGSNSDDAPDLPVPGCPPDVRARMRRDRDRETHAGLRKPSPDR